MILISGLTNEACDRRTVRVRYWPKAAIGVEWRVAGIPPKAAAR
jgi:hypothetical protein